LIIAHALSGQPSVANTLLPILKSGAPDAVARPLREAAKPIYENHPAKWISWEC
jgi:hypothetical protein